MRLVMALFLAIAQPAAAAVVVSPAAQALNVTAYRDPYDNRGPGWFSDVAEDEESGKDGSAGLALITEERLVDLPAGSSTVQFRGVADGMIPQSARLDGLPEPVREQNFDYNLLTPGRLIQRFVGRPVSVVRLNRTTGRSVEESGRLRSGPTGLLVDFGDRTEALHCGDQYQKLVFNRVPDDLLDKPVLSVSVRTPRAGRYRLSLSYLVVGVSWTANYVAVLSRDGRTMDLTGAITMRNDGDVAFPNASLQVVAGRWNKVEDDGAEPVDLPAPHVDTACWASAHGRVRWGKPVVKPQQRAGYGGDGGDDLVVTGSRIPAPRYLADYQLYDLPERSTLAAHQTKQLALLDQHRVLLDRVYRADARGDLDFRDEEDTPAEVVLKAANVHSRGLGVPIPAGMVTVFQSDASGPVLAGIDKTIDVPVDRDLSVSLGAAADVWTRARTISEIEEDGQPTRRTLEVTVFNGKAQPISFDLMLFRWGYRLVSTDSKLTGLPDGKAWRFSLKAGEKRSVRYTVVETDD